MARFTNGTSKHLHDHSKHPLSFQGLFKISSMPSLASQANKEDCFPPCLHINYKPRLYIRKNKSIYCHYKMFPFFIYLKEWKHFTYFFTTYKPKAPVAQTPVRHLAPLWTAVITAVVVVVVIDVVVAVSACLSRGRRGVSLIGT